MFHVLNAILMSHMTNNYDCMDVDSTKNFFKNCIQCSSEGMLAQNVGSSYRDKRNYVGLDGQIEVK